MQPARTIHKAHDLFWTSFFPQKKLNNPYAITWRHNNRWVILVRLGLAWPSAFLVHPYIPPMPQKQKRRHPCYKISAIPSWCGEETYPKPEQKLGMSSGNCSNSSTGFFHTFPGETLQLLNGSWVPIYTGISLSFLNKQTNRHRMKIKI